MTPYASRMNWELLIAQLGMSGSVLGAVAWLSKSLVSQQLARVLEAFRCQLSVEAERDRVRFSKLHERRAEVIEELYSKIFHIVGILRLQGSHSTEIKETSEHIDGHLIELGR